MLRRSTAGALVSSVALLIRPLWRMDMIAEVTFSAVARR